MSRSDSRPPVVLRVVAGTALQCGATASAGRTAADAVAGRPSARSAAAGGVPPDARRGPRTPSAPPAHAAFHPAFDAGAAWMSFGAAWVEASMRFWLDAIECAAALGPHFLAAPSGPPFCAGAWRAPHFPWAAVAVPPVVAHAWGDPASRTRGALVLMGAWPAS